MVRATDTVGEGDGSIDVCLDPGVGGMMERTLTVLLNFTNGVAGKSVLKLRQIFGSTNNSTAIDTASSWNCFLQLL